VFRFLSSGEDTWIIGYPFFHDYLFTYDNNKWAVQIDGLVNSVHNPYQVFGWVEMIIIGSIVFLVVSSFIIISVKCIKMDEERKQKLIRERIDRKQAKKDTRRSSRKRKPKNSHAQKD